MKKLSILPAFAAMMALCVASCSSPQTQEPQGQEPPDEAPLALMVYEATWLPAENATSPQVRVAFEMQLDWVDPQPTSLTLFFAPLEFADGNHSGLRFVEPDTTAEIDAERAALTWPVTQGVAQGAYTITLAHPNFESLRGLDNIPHPTQGGWSIPGMALFPTLARINDGREVDVPTSLSVSLPEGWNHHHSANAMGFDEMYASSVKDFGFAIHTFGTYNATHIQRGESVVRLLTSDYTEGELEPLRLLIESTLELGTSLLGQLSPGALTIVVDRVGDTYEGGLVGTRGIVLSGPDLASLRAHEMPGLIVVHELMHLWNRADEMWLNEGFTRMLEIALPVLLEELDPDAATQELRKRLERYHQLAGTSRTVAGDAQAAWPYEGGLAVLLCTEAGLRNAGSSLLAVHQKLRAQHGLPLPVAHFKAELDALAPGLAAQLEGWMTHPGAIDLAPCLTSLGFEAASRMVLVPGMRTLVVEMFQVTGIDTDRMVVEKIVEGSQIEVGDVLQTLAGEPISSLESAAYALRGKNAGDRVVLRVQRGEQSVSITLTMPELMAGDAGNATERHVLEMGPGSAQGRIFTVPPE